MMRGLKSEFNVFITKEKGSGGTNIKIGKNGVSLSTVPDNSQHEQLSTELGISL
jgi:hypothetical protein